MIATDERIVGGSEINANRYPWLTALVQHGNPSKLICGGTLISSKHILTAAHCFKSKQGLETRPAEVLVRLGAHNLTESSGQAFDIENVMLFPFFQYSSENQAPYFDLALLTLNESAPLSNHIRPVCFHSLPFARKIRDIVASLRNFDKNFDKNFDRLEKNPNQIRFKQRPASRLDSLSKSGESPLLNAVARTKSGDDSSGLFPAFSLGLRGLIANIHALRLRARQRISGYRNDRNKLLNAYSTFNKDRLNRLLPGSGKRVKFPKLSSNGKSGRRGSRSNGDSSDMSSDDSRDSSADSFSSSSVSSGGNRNTALRQTGLEDSSESLNRWPEWAVTTSNYKGDEKDPKALRKATKDREGWKMAEKIVFNWFENDEEYPENWPKIISDKLWRYARKPLIVAGWGSTVSYGSSLFLSDVPKHAQIKEWPINLCIAMYGAKVVNIFRSICGGNKGCVGSSFLTNRLVHPPINPFSNTFIHD